MTCRTASGSSSRATSRTVSYWPANDAPARSSAVAEERTANRCPCRSVSSAAAWSRRVQVCSQSAAAVGVTTTPAGTGEAGPARRARLAALVPNSACAWAGSRPAASARVTTGGSVSGLSWWGWVWARIGVWLAIVVAPCSGPVLAARMVLALVGGHGPQPEVGQFIDDLLQRPGRRTAGAWPGLGLRSRQQVHHDRAGQGLHRQDRVHRAETPGGHLFGQVVRDQGQGAHPLGHVLAGAGVAVWAV